MAKVLRSQNIPEPEQPEQENEEEMMEKENEDSQKRERLARKGVGSRRGKILVLPILGRVFGSLFLLLFLFCIGLGCGLLYFGLVDLYPMVSDLHKEAQEIFLDIDENSFAIIEPTRVYDKDGDLIYKVGGTNGTFVPISEISVNLQNAYRAMEDRQFDEHDGISYKALLRAGLSIIKTRSISQGGSTITQQIIKNNLLTQERSFDRKVKEFFLAYYVDAVYSKDRIMEIYCNTNYYGNNCYGVEAASQYYFGKPASQLTADEAAILASLSARPSACDPKTHMDALERRRNLTLQAMCDEGYLSEEECTAAKAKPIELVYQRQEYEEAVYPGTYALHCAAVRMMERDGFQLRYTFSSEEDRNAYVEEYNERYHACWQELNSGGYSLYTSIDMEQQNILQTAVDNALASNIETQEDGRYAFQGAAVAIDNQTGYVTAIVGGRGTEDGYNRAYLSFRQPASAIKPLLVYGPAYETGLYGPQTVMVDEHFMGAPRNAYEGYLGEMSLEESLARSTNTICFRLMKNISPVRGMVYLDAMRFHGITYHDRYNSATSLGGFDYGCRVVDMARGYYTLANDGVYTNQDCLLAVMYQNKGTALDMKTATQRIYTSNTVAGLKSSMRAVLEQEYGTGNTCQVPGVISYAKTGTANGCRDAWFCGFSAYYTIAAWSGYDMPKDVAGDACTYSGRIWQQGMAGIHQLKGSG